jgi:peptidoglycan/xylan/chitin deacetylase (PgdA/CDA1 family)
MALTAALVVGLVLPPPSSASIEPARPATPTGCSSNVFSLEIEAHPAWGVVPFETVLRVSLRSTDDSLETVWWDFESDGAVDASGREVSHTFGQPVDYAVTATVRTAERGEIELKKTVEGYVAVMSLTFDDGCKSVYSHAMPVLGARGVTATAYIVPTWVKDYGATYMSWDDIQVLADLGWDIGSHTMTHVSLEGVDDSTLQYELYESREALRAHGLDAENFSLPFGEYDEHALDEVEGCYKSCRMVGNALNPPVEFTDPYALLSKTSQPWITLAQYQADIDNVAAAGGWYILNNHRVWGDCYDSGWCITYQTLAGIVDYAIDSRLKVADVREVLGYRQASEENSRLPGEANEDDAAPGGIVWTHSNPLHLPGQIQFRLPAPATARAMIYDCRGRHVKDLECSPAAGCEHEVSWDGLNSEGKSVAGGVYYCVITVGGEAHSSGPILILR